MGNNLNYIIYLHIGYYKKIYITTIHTVGWVIIENIATTFVLIFDG